MKEYSYHNLSEIFTTDYDSELLINQKLENKISYAEELYTDSCDYIENSEKTFMNGLFHFFKNLKKTD